MRTYLLVHDDIDLNTLFSLALEQPIEAPLRVVLGRAAEVDFGGEPPIKDHDARPGSVDHLGHGIEEIVSIDVPFDKVTCALIGERAEAMGVVDLCADAVLGLLLRAIVATCYRSARCMAFCTQRTVRVQSP